jgi:stearoyl-CoA desaturase (delta-9 desaturase)
VQGATVNWCGHKYGYRNFNNDDHSRNTGNIGILLGGELFQNNHHRYPDSPNFAKRWFELDPTYVILKVLNGIKVIRFKKSET